MNKEIKERIMDFKVKKGQLVRFQNLSRNVEKKRVRSVRY